MGAPKAEALRRRRRYLDVVWLGALMIGGSNLLWLGYGAAWPLILMAACAVVMAVALIMRALLTRQILRLDPPLEPAWKRSWPDGT
jgi:hypothetical protein